MPRLLVLALCVVLFCVAVYFILSIVPAQFHQLAVVIFVVLGIAVLITWLLGGKFPTLPAA